MDFASGWWLRVHMSAWPNLVLRHSAMEVELDADRTAEDANVDSLAVEVAATCLEGIRLDRLPIDVLRQLLLAVDDVVQITVHATRHIHQMLFVAGFIRVDSLHHIK